MFASLFHSVPVENLSDNFIKLISDDWMLITAGKAGDFNTMTANWGMLGYLWHKPVAICFIRPQRYTFEFANQNEYFTLSFFAETHRKILDFCGVHSGRDVDKVKQTGLKPVETNLGNITFEQARLVMECRKLYADDLKPDNFLLKDIIGKNYPHKDFHRFFIASIEKCFKKT